MSPSGVEPHSLWVVLPRERSGIALDGDPNKSILSLLKSPTFTNISTFKRFAQTQQQQRLHEFHPDFKIPPDFLRGLKPAPTSHTPPPPATRARPMPDFYSSPAVISPSNHQHLSPNHTVASPSEYHIPSPQLTHLSPVPDSYPPPMTTSPSNHQHLPPYQTVASPSKYLALKSRFGLIIE